MWYEICAQWNQQFAPLFSRDFSSAITDMDIEKIPNEQKLDMCRKYYLGGFACLPFLWFVNFCWFFREAFFKPSYPEQKQIKTYVVRSLVGAIIWTGIIIAWVTVFQLYRADWGATADRMSFIIPKGIA